MTLLAVGLSHHTCPVEMREQLGFSATALPAALMRLHKRIGGGGIVILSTCNRVEAYVHHTKDAPDLQNCISGFFAEWHNLPEKTFLDALYVYKGADVAAHLFRVASSLDSLVVGEVQILGQVHDAYLVAHAEQVTDKVIHGLFQQAFALAKRIRTRTAIGEGKVSISSVAVDLAASALGALQGKTILVLGSGETAELTLRSLLDQGAHSVLVANRNPDRAARLAAQYGAEALPFGAFHQYLHRADIVVSATSAPHLVLCKRDFEDAIAKRENKPMLVIDIAVPRDIEPEVGSIEHVHLYDIDDLETVVRRNLSARRQEMEQALAMVDKQTRRFSTWLSGIAADPTIESMTEEVHAIRREELNRTLAVMPDLTDTERTEIERLTERLTNRILLRPMRGIKQELDHHDPGTVIHLAKRLFGLEE